MSILDYANAIASIESAGSGGYSAVGPLTKKGNRAYGRYQVMDFNVGPWTEKYLGNRMTPEEFLADQAAQDRVFEGEFGGYVSKYGNPQDAASMWFTGRPANQGGSASDVLGTTGNQYVSKFNRAMGDDTLLGGLSIKPGRGAREDRLEGFDMPEDEEFHLLGPKARKYFTPERMAGISLALNGMSMFPNRGVEAMALQKMQSAGDERKANKTAQWLASPAVGREDLAQAVLSGAIDPRSAVAAAMQRGDEKRYTVGDTLVDANGNVVFDGRAAPGAITEDQIKNESAVRKEYLGQNPVKDFAKQASAFGRIRASAKDPTAAGDMALIFNYMKLLDPGSTVREGEFASAQNAGGIDDRVQSLYNNVLNGTLLTPDQRADFMGRAESLYGDAERQHQGNRAGYVQTAEQYGMDPNRTVPDQSYIGEYAPTQSPRPTRSGGVPSGGSADPVAAPRPTPQQVQAAVQGLSPLDRELIQSLPTPEAKLRFLQEKGLLQ